MMTRELQIGDEAWLAVAGVRKEAISCPVCAGKKTVTVILGDGARVVVGCEYCGKGYEGPQGIVYEYVQEPTAERVRVSSRRVEEEDGQRRVEYHTARHYAGEGENLYATEAEAIARAQTIAAENDRHERDRRDGNRTRATKNAGWTAGYHMQRARKLREEAERHERWATEIRAEKGTT
jgi:hypothetical protein